MIEPGPEPERDPAVGTEATTDLGRAPGRGRDVARDLSGTTIGDFRVVRLLGRGGMGEVYLATQTSLNRPVALKVLRPEMLSNPTYLGRFEAEAWSAAKLNHPNIVHIYMVGALGDVRFIAMEYVEGTNLREFINRKGPPELSLALSIMRQTALALGVAAELGLIHRDIKPENLLLTKKGQVKVADFGLCRDTEGDRLHLTQPGVTMGTPLYMSPEQVQGHRLDHRSDLYSMGVTFYHMLAGRAPFRAESAVALALKHVRDQPVSLGVHRPDLPPELVGIVMKLMAKPAADRYQSTAEFLRDLARAREAVQAGATASVSMPEIPIVPLEAPARSSRPSVPALDLTDLGRRLGKVRVDRKMIAAVSILAIAIGALGGWLGRADDLLGPEAPTTSGPPGLWMAPWERVARLPTAEAQYHHAQLQAPEADRVAAWLAVPGRFPGDVRHGHHAYTQLVRTLFRRREAAILKALTAELDRSSRHGQKMLGSVAGAAVAALEGDVNGVLNRLDSQAGGTASLEEGLAELSLEVVEFARRLPEARPHESTLAKIARARMQDLRLDLVGSADLAPPH